LEWNFLYFALTNIAFLANIFRWFVAKKDLKLVPFGTPYLIAITRHRIKYGVPVMNVVPVECPCIFAFHSPFYILNSTFIKKYGVPGILWIPVFLLGFKKSLLFILCLSFL